jgi:hypothetical protein
MMSFQRRRAVVAGLAHVMCVHFGTFYVRNVDSARREKSDDPT